MKKQPKLLSRASLRRPFIVTVSAIAAIGAAACGGQTEEVGGAEGEIVTNPPAPTCPTEQPADGDACRIASSRRCGYKDCGGSPAVNAECKTDGKWHVSEMSCNPPPPPSCPTSQPIAGDACYRGSATLECGYKDCFGTPAVTAKCDVNGTWTVSERSCNPPPPPPPPPSSCPAVQPVAGAACNLDPSQACGYKDCFGSPAVTATCEADKTWSVSERSCNPPPPPPEP